MARIASKLNWTSDPDNAPLPSDFNRIENNNQQAFNEIDANEGQRAIDEASLQANIDAEEVRAIADVDAEQARATAAEGTLQTNINNEASARAAITTALKTIDTVNSIAFLRSNAAITKNPGTDHDSATLGQGLYYSNASNSTGPSVTGVWRCLGYMVSGSATLFIKIS